MPRRAGPDLHRAASLSVFSVLVLAACSGSDVTPAGQNGPSDASSAAGGSGTGGANATGGAISSGGASLGSGGFGIAGASPTDAGSGCDANRGTGIPANSGTLSASVDGQTLSGPGTILWAGGLNTLTLQTASDGMLVVIFPGCGAANFSVPGTGAKPDPISVTYTAAGGDPQWGCTYEDTNPGPANCVIDVTAYGEKQNTPVTGTFSGVLRLRRGTGATSKTVSNGTFTFGRP